MLRLEPSSHALPDNGWQTFWIIAISGLFLWLGWNDLVDTFRSGEPASHMEEVLLEGGGHPLYAWVETELADSATPWVWNRVISSSAWFLSLVLVGRILTRRGGFLSALPCLILVTTFPGLSLWMSSAGSGSPGLFFFLLGLSAVTLEEREWAWLRGGGYVAVAVLLYPLWFLPALGLLAGAFEAHRPRLPRLAIGFGVTLVIGGLLLLTLVPDGFSVLIPGPAERGGGLDAGARILLRHVFLAGMLTLMIVYGSTRRGVGWWTLILAMPAICLHPWLASVLPSTMVPVLVLFVIGLAKLPALIDVRHPRAFQTVLLCQLLLWLPVYLGHQSSEIFDPPATKQPIPVESEQPSPS